MVLGYCILSAPGADPKFLTDLLCLFVLLKVKLTFPLGPLNKGSFRFRHDLTSKVVLVRRIDCSNFVINSLSPMVLKKGTGCLNIVRFFILKFTTERTDKRLFSERLLGQY